MEKMFVPVILKRKIGPEAIKDISKKLPKRIVIAYSIQYEEIARQLRDSLKEKEIVKFVQVLGCSKMEFGRGAEAILVVSDGKFHAIPIVYNSEIPVYIFDSFSLKRLTNSDIKEYEKKKNASYINFLNSDKVGIFVSVKPGQERMEKAIKFKKKMADKKAYLFVGNNFDKSEFENFPEIKSWVNAACPRLDMDSPKIINIDALKKAINISDFNSE